jgi:excisionase family DNA binding protein
MTVKEAAESKGLSYWTVYGAMERGEFERARLPGKHSAVSRASFERWAAQK